MEFLKDELVSLESANRRRHPHVVQGPQDREITVDGRRTLNFSSNNYLGLAAHAEVRKSAEEALRLLGVGSGASRLIAGTEEHHLRAEAALARFHEREAALLFNSGYQANVGAIQALVGREDEVFSDELNHASIIDGCRLSRATVRVYPHRDVATLRDRLRASKSRRRLVVTDAIFSMDGDRAPLADLRRLCNETDAMLMVDEAHAVGVIGPRGRGLSAALGVEPDVLVGTLGKAFGTFGAYVAGSSDLRSLVLNRARSFVYSTAIPAALAAATTAALSLLAGKEGRNRRAQLEANAEQLRVGLSALGIESQATGPAIFPVHIGDEKTAMECSRQLLERGVFVQGIRPPTVPPGTARLRIALMSSHTGRDIEQLLEGLAEILRGS